MRRKGILASERSRPMPTQEKEAPMSTAKIGLDALLTL